MFFWPERWTWTEMTIKPKGLEHHPYVINRNHNATYRATYGSSNTHRELDAETIRKQWLDSIPNPLNVMFKNIWKASDVSIPLLGPLLCFCCLKAWGIFPTIVWPTLMALNKSTSPVALRFANMLIASHQEDKVEWVSEWVSDVRKWGECRIQIGEYVDAATSRGWSHCKARFAMKKGRFWQGRQRTCTACAVFCSAFQSEGRHPAQGRTRRSCTPCWPAWDKQKLHGSRCGRTLLHRGLSSKFPNICI